MLKQGQKSKAFFERAKAVTPYGVSSNYRNYGDETPVIADAEGGYLYDFDGNRYIDYRLGWGPVLIGHADEFVNARVKEAIDHGVSFAGTQRYEVSVCERIIDLCPGVEMVRLANTGTECTMHAIRLARGYTGRDVILKFEGSYHGAHDNVMWSTQGASLDKVGDRKRPFPVKNSLGIPKVMDDLIVLSPWNDEEVLGDILTERGEEIAAIIVEPMLGNSNALPPSDGYLQFLRDQCDQYGIVLIFDEVKTGFRIAPGGAREYFDVIPDLSTYAKAMGNGYPVAAFAGKKELMMNLAYGKVFQGGTYTGNVVSTAAADATLELVQSGQVFKQINQIGTILQDGIREICQRHGVPMIINGAPGMFGVCFAEERPRDWRELMTNCDWDFSAKVYAHLLENGVMPEEGGIEPFFICAAHSASDAEETLQRFEEGVVLAKGGGDG
ncbi:MAG: guanitoxin biosynthesis PLP-dependent transaminase GntE [Chloroflexota bacterium]